MKNFFSLISAEQAYAHIGSLAALAVESVAWDQALGRVLASPVVCTRDVPHFERSNMDGFAVRASDSFGASEESAVRLRITGEVAMGREATVAVGKGEAVRVSTGAMLPPGADAVVIVENTEEPTRGDLRVRAEVVPGQNTIKVGEELHAGDTVLPVGKRIKAADLGALTVAGATEITAYRRPIAGVIVTGDEIVDPGRELRPGEVRNVNQFVLRALASGQAECRDYGVVGDDAEAIAKVLTLAVKECDAVFVSGGSSKGTKDLTLGALESLGSAEVLFHGVAIAPGKPTILVRTPGCAVMGLPGNPAAAAVVFHLFGSTLLRVLEGESVEKVLATRASARAVLAETLGSTQGREEYVRVRLDPRGPGELPLAVPMRGKSAAITTVARADALLRIAASTEGLAADSEVEVMLL